MRRRAALVVLFAAIVAVLPRWVALNPTPEVLRILPVSCPLALHNEIARLAMVAKPSFCGGCDVSCCTWSRRICMPPQAECRQAIQVLSDGSAVSKRARGDRACKSRKQRQQETKVTPPDMVMILFSEMPWKTRSATPRQHINTRRCFGSFDSAPSGRPARCCSARSAGGLMFLFCCQ